MRGEGAGCGPGRWDEVPDPTRSGYFSVSVAVGDPAIDQISSGVSSHAHELPPTILRAMARVAMGHA